MDASLRGHSAYQQQPPPQSRHQNYHRNGSSGLSASLSGQQQQQQPHHQQQQYQQQHQQQQQYQQQHQQQQYQHQHQHQHQQQHHHQQHQQQQQQQQQASDYMSVGSHYSRESQGSQSQSQAITVVDEAYRRLGRKLSVRAHGDGPLQRPRRLSRIGLALSSGFAPYQEPARTTAAATATNKDGTEAPQSQDPAAAAAAAAVGSLTTLTTRTTKVAKTKYSDHGDHHHHKIQSHNGNILRKMTMNATELFKLWNTEQQPRGRKKRSPKPQAYDKQKVDLSPQRFALSQLDLGDGGGSASGSASASGGHSRSTSQQEQNNHHHHSSDHQHMSDHLFSSNASKGESMLSKQPGLLSSVIENASVTSASATNKGFGDNGSLRSLNSRTSSIATKSSVGTNMSSFRTLPQGKCLTQPSEAMSNDGADNAEGNLIVHENDPISVSRKQIHVLTRDKLKNATNADFRIQSLLGQGTFAQVFRCLHLQTGNVVAVKVIKNKPAYTRQAAVEIDVFRALTKKQEKPASSSQSQSKLSVSPTNSTTDGNVADKNGGTKCDYMVDMVCYFMYKNHLCLVFEVLGLNLYEVLKKRQFRGLPLTVVRTLVKQAVGGAKELAKKNIVHCDLKPENILLATEDDVDSVVGAGEAKRIGSSLEKNKSSGLVKNRNSLDKKQMGEPPISSSGMGKVIDGNPAMTPTTVDVLSQSPTNSLATTGTAGTQGISLMGKRIKLIDFGSACFEGQTAHTYIQSRFYRSPEVLIGLPYDSAIDMWSLGCVAAELFLGLPILPGVHEHDQLSRICEMVSELPDWMLDQGSKSSKYFVKYVPRGDVPHASTPTPPPPTQSSDGSSAAPSRRPLPPQWRVRTQPEYIASLSQSEIRKKGGLAKLEKQPANRYFKRKKLSDIIQHKGMNGSVEDKELLELFIHFLYGILDPDPWKRWTAHQASFHPFVIGGPIERRKDRPNPQSTKDENQANLICDMYWEAPWDPGICRRKLLNVQKMREKQHAARRGFSSNRSHNVGHARSQSSNSHDGSMGDRGGSSTRESPSMGTNGRSSPPSIPENTMENAYDQQDLGAAMGNRGLAAQMQQQAAYQLSSSLTDYASAQGVPGRFAGDNSSVISGSQPYPAGPQSYSEAGYTGVLPGSFSELDFAYALQRPGVVPMGGSVASSVDMSSGPTPHHHHGQQHVVGSYGANRIQHRGQRRGSSKSASAATSRSFGEMPDPSNDPRRHSLGQAPNSLGQQMPYGSHGSFGGPTNGMVQPVEGPMLQIGSAPMAPIGGAPMAQIGSARMAQDSSMPGELQQQLAYGQAYIQQQHAALQQQQALLQQQQAALALQQQQLQLQAYNINPAGLMNGAQQNGGGNYGAGNQYAQAGGGGGGYYYVQSVDGTPMMVPNQAVPQAGMTSSYGMQPQQQNMGTYPNQNIGGEQGFHPPDGGNFRGGMSM